jgi:hypothetical protein
VLGARKKPYGKKWLWPAQDPQETHRRPRCLDFLMVHPYCMYVIFYFSTSMMATIYIKFIIIYNHHIYNKKNSE